MRHYINCALVMKVILGGPIGLLIAVVASGVIAIGIPVILTIIATLFFLDLPPDGWSEFVSVVFTIGLMFGGPMGAFYGASTFLFYHDDDKTPPISKLAVGIAVSLIGSSLLGYSIELSAPGYLFYTIYGVIAGGAYNRIVASLFAPSSNRSYAVRGLLSGALLGIISGLLITITYSSQYGDGFAIGMGYTLVNSFGSGIGGLLFGVVGSWLARSVEAGCAWLESRLGQSPSASE